MRESLIQRILRISQVYADLTALMYKDERDNFVPLTYRELALDFMKVGYFLRHNCKVKKGDHIAIVCDNRYEWVPLDFGILSLGAVDVPRGSETKVEELAYILEHSDSVGCVLENAKMFDTLYGYNKRLLKKFKFFIIIEDFSPKHPHLPRHTYSYKDIVSRDIGESAESEMTDSIMSTSPSDRATVIYTSGTTAEPKGVCLSQGAFEVQIDRLTKVVPIGPRNVFLSILPPWHAYAREVQYVVLGKGATIAFSKPVGKILLEDIKKTRTNFLTSVPRIWEAVYTSIHRNVRNSSVIKKGIFHSAVKVAGLHNRLRNLIIGNVTGYKMRIRPLDSLLAIVPYLVLLPLRSVLDALVFKKIRALLGHDFIAGVSGGGALPPHVDAFFDVAKIKVLEGYGLTETGPVLSVRRLKKPQLDSVGEIFEGIEYKIVTPEGNAADLGEQGVLHIRSDQNMQGYYKNQSATESVVSADGWLNTGDIVVQARNGTIAIKGRAKDTIVLMSGENVEPTHVETMLMSSDFIDQVMVFGQDKKNISALIVPNHEALLAYAFDHKLPQNVATLCLDKKVIKLYEGIVHSYRHRLTPSEQVYNFALIAKPFEVGDELTQTLKMKRRVISEKYQKEINACYA